MPLSLPDAFEDTTQADVLRVEQCKQLYAGMPSAIIVNALLALILVSGQASVISPARTFGWLGVIGLVLLARTVLALAWHRSDPDDAGSARLWIHRFRFIAIATGVSWGAGSILLFPEGNITHQVFLAFVLAGLSAGAVTLLAVDRKTALGFLVLMVLPLIVRFAVEGDAVSLAMCAMIAVYLIFVVTSVVRIGRAFNENIRLRIDADMRERMLRQNEERLNQAQQIAHLGSFAWNPASGELRWSDEHFRLWGLQPSSVAPSYALFRQGVHPDDVLRVEEDIQRALEGGQHYDCEHRIVRSDGTVRHVHGRGEVAFDASGRATRMMGTLQDITESKQAEELLLHINEQLEHKVAVRTADLMTARIEAEQASRAKSDFLATMSHEIRTPMNGVIGMVEVLQRSSLDGVQMEMANTIHDSAFALLSIIDDILDFSKIEAGKFQLENVSMDVSNVVEGLCETLYPIALKKGVELTLFTDPAIPAELMGDAGRLRQILVNLTNNAIKFSAGRLPRGRVSVRAQLVESGLERATLQFRVIDNGIGMDEATLGRLFTPFTQADSTTTRKFGGSGLGLAISRQLLNIMGGSIEVQSDFGVGSEFTVHLSFARPSSGDNASATPSWITGLPCLVLGGTGGRAEDLAVYLAHAGAVVAHAADLVGARAWVGSRAPGLYVVVIDAADARVPLEELRAVARDRPGMDLHFVSIKHDRHWSDRFVAGDMVELGAEVMHRRAFLEAVAIACGRVKDAGRKGKQHVAKESLAQGCRILVAEDNEINQKVLRQQLKLFGQVADFANDGREALALWQSGDYGLVFTDLHMPEMDGYELTAAIRTSETGNVRVPIIAVTANAVKGEAERCQAVGMNDYLSKPVKLEDLKVVLEKWTPGVVQPVLVGKGAPVQTALPSVAVDVSVLKSLVGNEEALVREFLHDFHTSVTGMAIELRAASIAGQLSTAGAVAHKLKSSSRSVGALGLGDLCAEIERVSKAGEQAALLALLPRFDLELANVGHFLETY